MAEERTKANAVPAPASVELGGRAAEVQGRRGAGGGGVVGEEAPVGYLVATVDGFQMVAFGVTPHAAAKYALQRLEEGAVVASVVRCEKVDVFTPGPAPVQDLIEHLGFVWYCLNCNTQITEEMFDYEEDRELKPVYDDEAQIAFCCPECAIEYDKQQRKSLN